MPPIWLWRLIREVYTYKGARIWWTSRNQMLDGQAPRDAAFDDVHALIQGLIDGVYL